MKIERLSWSRYIGDDIYEEHVLPFPTWQDIEQKIRQLDAEYYPTVSLRLHNRDSSYPCLTIVGGAGIYSAEVDLGDDDGQWTGERLGYIDFDLYFSFQDTPVRNIGLGYHNHEIDEVYLTQSVDLILKLAKYYAETATWHPDVACAAM